MTYRGAVVSDCAGYRMWLWRSRFERVRRAVAWVLNNPSTADADNDDPTVRRAWAFSTSWGYDSMIFVNTNPHRSTNPKLARVPPESVLEANDDWLRHAITGVETVICGWGDKANPDLARRAVRVMHSLGPLHALRITKAGSPQHPLYLPGNLTPTLWNPERWLH